MKKSKHGRKIGYGIAGLTIGIVIYLLLQSKVPLSVDSRSTIMEFTNEQESSEHVLDDEDYNGLVKKPFLEYGSYHVSDVELDRYEKNHVTYGKPNPTFFLKREASKEEEEITYENCNELIKDYPNGVEKDHFAYQSKLDRDNDGIACEDDSEDKETMNFSSSNTGGNTLEGFNIHTKELESVDVSNIMEQFKHAVLPVDEENYNISSTFGKRTDPFEEVTAYHVGLDMATNDIEGANIYSVLDGEIIEKVSGNKGLGNYVVVKHDGFETLYAHMISPSHLNVGDYVEAGESLGFVGSTGRSTGPHLHFEVGIGGLKLNPEVFIDKIGGTD